MHWIPGDKLFHSTGNPKLSVLVLFCFNVTTFDQLNAIFLVEIMTYEMHFILMKACHIRALNTRKLLKMYMNFSVIWTGIMYGFFCFNDVLGLFIICCNPFFAF